MDIPIPQKNEELGHQIQKLLEKGPIEAVTKPHSTGFHLRLFLVPKISCNFRPDLSTLNIFLETKTFVMETPERIRTTLQEGESDRSIDLMGAYLHIPVCKNHHLFRRFIIQNKIYLFRATPFGLSTAPLLFTDMARQVQIMAFKMKIVIHKYLDDWIIRAKSFQQSQEFTSRILQLTEHLGFIVKSYKSLLWFHLRCLTL